MPPSTVIGSREAIYEAVRQRMGASIVPRGEVLRDPDLRVIALDPPAPVINEYLYYLEGRQDTRLLGAFLECLVLPPS
jgi:DNA-binding transcriptional LysR family regulator